MHYHNEIDYDLLSDLLKKATFDANSFIDDFTSSDFNGSKQQSNTNSIDEEESKLRNLWFVKKDNPKPKQQQTYDIDDLEKDDETPTSPITIDQSYLSQANSDLSNYNFTPHVKKLLQYAIALHYQYPKFTQQKNYAEYITKACFSNWSKQYNIFIDPNSSSPKDINMLAKIKDKTIFDIPDLPTLTALDSEKSLEDYILYIMQDAVAQESNSKFTEALKDAISLYTDLKENLLEQQQKELIQKTEQQQIQEEVKLHSNFFQKIVDNIQQQAKSEEWDKNLLLKDKSQLSGIEQIKQQQQLKRLKHSNLPDLEQDGMNDLNNSARRLLLTYLTNFVKKINGYIGHPDKYEITPERKANLVELRTKVNEIMKDARAYHNYKYYNALYEKLSEEYGIRFEHIKVPTLISIKNKDKMPGKRRNTKWHEAPRENISLKPTNNPKYQIIENYIVYDGDNGSNIPGEYGGLFDWYTNFLEDYQKYIEGKSNLFKNNLLKLANKILIEVKGLLNVDQYPVFLEALPNVTKEQIADELTTWYKEHIVLDKSKYYLMLKKACQAAFERFYNTYADKLNNLEETINADLEAEENGDF